MSLDFIDNSAVFAERSHGDYPSGTLRDRPKGSRLKPNRAIAIIDLILEVVYFLIWAK